jgi:hypothetical protein
MVNPNRTILMTVETAPSSCILWILIAISNRKMANNNFLAIQVHTL